MKVKVVGDEFREYSSPVGGGWEGSISDRRYRAIGQLKNFDLFSDRNRKPLEGFERDPVIWFTFLNIHADHLIKNRQ